MIASIPYLILTASALLVRYISVHSVLKGQDSIKACMFMSITASCFVPNRSLHAVWSEHCNDSWDSMLIQKACVKR